MNILNYGNSFFNGDGSSLIKTFIEGYDYEYPITRTNKRLYASSAGYCERKEVWLTSNTTGDRSSASGKLYSEIGKTVENVIQRSWKKQGILIASNLKVNWNRFNLGGEVDAVVMYPGTDKLTIVEIKSCNKLPKEPKLPHISQASLYSAITGLPSVIYYQTRNVADWSSGAGILEAVEFPIPDSDDYLLPYVEKVIRSFLYARDELSPPIPAGFRRTVHCSFCPFIERCWNTNSLIYPLPSDKKLEEYERIIKREAEQYLERRPRRRENFLTTLRDKVPTSVKERIQ